MGERDGADEWGRLPAGGSGARLGPPGSEGEGREVGAREMGWKSAQPWEGKVFLFLISISLLFLFYFCVILFLFLLTKNSLDELGDKYGLCEVLQIILSICK
jgi:hypothetical protein